ncbi:MAG TPA: hypothetical protein VHO95_06810 [Candidatus Dormibacteraeota bacterium]|jgi:hypothetical protein|nr:hypothetical protein [Candidatus Dormibacteraeota bacterium]
MQALGSQYGMLQSARGATISESSSRSSLYLTSLTGSVVGLSFVAQASKFGDTFFVFALAILPVVFFLGVVTYYRTLQTGVEDVIYGLAMGKIRKFYSEIDPAQGDFFEESTDFRVGLERTGLWTHWWQQFLSAAATVAIINSVVGGVCIAIFTGYFFAPPVLVLLAIGFVAAVLISFVFLRHQWSIWIAVSRRFQM